MLKQHVRRKCFVTKSKQINASKQIANERILQNMIMIQTDRKSWAKLN